MNKLVKWMTGLVTVLVALIGAGGFILSYGALLAIGISNGMPGDWRGYIWPLLTDAGLIVFTLSLLVAQLKRQRVAWWVGGVVFLSLSSMAYNVAHADLTGKTVYGVCLTVAVTVWPSLMLVITTEALRHLVKMAIEQAGMVVTMTELGLQKTQLETEVAALRQAQVAASEGRKPKQLSPKEKAAIAKERREKVLVAFKGGVTSVTKLAQEFEVSESTIQRDLGILNGRARG